MNIEKILLIAIIAVSILLVVLVLLQQGGAGLGTIFGGMGGEAYRTRRGAEKFIYYLMVAASIIWIGLLLANIFLNG